MLQDYRNRTECSVPYTIMQVEDVMFVNKRKMIALEYIYYNMNGQYSQLAFKEHDDQHCDHGTHLFGTEKYMDLMHPLSIYKNEPQNLEDRNNNYFRDHHDHVETKKLEDYPEDNRDDVINKTKQLNSKNKMA